MSIAILNVTLSVGLVFVLGGCVTFEPSGRVSTRTTKMPDVIPQIEKGKTTRADLIGKLGDPTSQSRDSEGNENSNVYRKGGHMGRRRLGVC